MSHGPTPIAMDADLEFTEGSGQGASERIDAWAGQKQGEGEKEFGESEFVPAVIDVETMRQVNKKDGAEHDEHHADCSDAKKSAGENGEATGELSQADEVADGRRRVHECSKGHRSRSAENAKENAAAVIEKWERASNAQDQQSKIELR